MKSVFACSIALAAVIAIQARVRGQTPAAGESVVLRWARTADRHPLRTGIALALLGAGLVPGKRRRGLQRPPNDASSGQEIGLKVEKIADPG